MLQNFSQCRLEKQQRSDVQLSERFASLDIMGAQLKAPLEPSQQYIIEGFRRGLNYAEGHQSIRQQMFFQFWDLFLIIFDLAVFEELFLDIFQKNHLNRSK